MEKKGQEILHKIGEKDIHEPESPSNIDSLQMERCNTIPADEVVDEAFSILEEIGI